MLNMDETIHFEYEV